MSLNNTKIVVRLRKLLVAEGWIIDRQIEDDQELLLMTHSDYPVRQLVIPTNTDRWDDWHELCQRAVEKLAQITGRDRASLWALVDVSPLYVKVYRVAKSSAPAAIVGSVLTVLAMSAWTWVTAPAPISVSLAGCIDSEGNKAVLEMAQDVGLALAESGDLTGDGTSTRSRALRATASAEEMRKCYLEAQIYSDGFDGDRAISDDISRIEDAIKVVYPGVGVSFVTDSRAQDLGGESARLAFTSAKAAGRRVSVRLGRMISSWHL
jgi:hypothetical protein